MCFRQFKVLSVILGEFLQVALHSEQVPRLQVAPPRLAVIALLYVQIGLWPGSEVRARKNAFKRYEHFQNCIQAPYIALEKLATILNGVLSQSSADKYGSTKMCGCPERGRWLK